MFFFSPVFHQLEKLLFSNESGHGYIYKAPSVGHILALVTRVVEATNLKSDDDSFEENKPEVRWDNLASNPSKQHHTH